MALILAIVQARMGSTRLPGKVLLDLEGMPVLWHVVNRVCQSKRIDKVIVATSTTGEDGKISDFCSYHNIPCFAGSENDVLDRYYQTARFAGAKEQDAMVRITADCPLIDSEVVDRVIDLFIESGADYVSNVAPPTYPDGLDVEVFTFAALEKAREEAMLLSEREHVTPYIRNNDCFNKANLQNDIDLSGLRWTLDEADDYELIKSIYAELYRKGNVFGTGQILALIEKQPQLLDKNNRFKRNEGYTKSVKNDFRV
jgi:spore coat polysaccharide biosynthesis protein SpsF